MRSSSRRILMVVHSQYPEDTRVVAEAQAATEAGFEVSVVALRGPGEEPLELVDGVRCRRLPVQHQRGVGFGSMVVEYARFTSLATAEAIRLHRRRRYDVVHVHNPPDFLVVAALLPRLLGAKVVLDVHDLSSDMFAMRFEGRPGAGTADRVLRLVERWSARGADAVVTVHEPYRRELAARGVPPSKITVVMNALDERLLPERTAPDLRDDAFTVLYHGTLTPHYGVHLLVEAAALVRERLPGLRVQIYGDGDSLPLLERRVGELGLRDVVHLNGFLAHAEVLRAARSASVGVVPNLPTRLNRFALSTKLFEYVALGIPVVSADLPTLREHFSDGEVVFFRAGDARSLAESLLWVAENPDASAQRASAARVRYDAYRWSRSAQRYVELLGRLTDRTRRSRSNA